MRTDQRFIQAATAVWRPENDGEEREKSLAVFSMRTEIKERQVWDIYTVSVLSWSEPR